MNIRHARSWAVASLLLTGTLVGCDSGERVNGVYYAPSRTTPNGIQIVRQQPAGLALELEKNPHATSWPGQGQGPETQVYDNGLILPDLRDIPQIPGALLDQLPKKTHPDPYESAIESMALDDRFGSRDLSPLNATGPIIRPSSASTTAPAAEVATGSPATPAATTEASSTTTAPSVAASQPAQQQGLSLAVSQKLTIDLATGKTIFTDTDGRFYPLTTSPADLEFFRKAAQTSSWRSGPFWPRQMLPNGQFLYTATALSGTDPIKDNARWMAPSPVKLPDTIKQMHQVFEIQQRNVHPLSETVDLLK